MLNYCIIEGNIAHDLALEKTTSGHSICKFTIYCRRDIGEAEDKIPVVTWNRLAEICAGNLGKGRTITVVGRLQSRGWEDKDGNKRVAYELNAERVYFGRKLKQEETKDDGDLPWED